MKFRSRSRSVAMLVFVSPLMSGVALHAALALPLNVGRYRVAFDKVNVGLWFLLALHKSDNGVIRA